MQKAEEFRETASAISRASGVSLMTINLYEKLGFIESIKISNGTRLFKPGAAKIVRQKRRERMANNVRNKGRGRPKAATEAV